MDNEKIKQMVNSHLKLFRLGAKVYNRLVLKNRLHPRGVKLSYGVALIDGLRIQCHGTDNEIVMGDFVRVSNSVIVIHRSHNRICIGDYALLERVVLCMEDDGNQIDIGQHVSLYGNTELAAIEGTTITVGDRCLVSGDVHFRTGDSHSVLDMEGKRINPSRDILIGEHVWIGTRVTCLKGVTVPKNCIVAATTTLCREYQQENAVIAGVPGKVTKTGVNWETERIEI